MSDRAREAEWQGGISIWNFNKDRKREEMPSAAPDARGVSVWKCLPVHSCMRGSSHLLILGISFWEF